MSTKAAADAASNTGDAEGGGRGENPAEVKGDAAGAASDVKDDTGATGKGPAMNAPAEPRRGRAPGTEGARRRAEAEGASASGGVEGNAGGVAAAPTGFAALGMNFAAYFNAQLRKATHVVKVAHKQRQWIVSQIDEGGVKVTEPNGAAVEYVEPTAELIAYLVSQIAHL